jgi:hypothetical protein
MSVSGVFRMKGEPMNRKSRLLSIACVLIGTSLLPAAQAQTPVPKVPPDLPIGRLKTVTISPASVVAGANLTGTVKLTRPAVGNLKVALALDGAALLVEGGVWNLKGVEVPLGLQVPDGRDQATFAIKTVRTDSWVGPNIFTITAKHGAESLSAKFTVVGRGRLSPPRP